MARSTRAQIARRRVVAVVTVAAVAGIAAGLGMSGGDNKTWPRQDVGPAMPPPLSQKKHPLGRRADAAVARFARLGYPVYCGGGKGRYVAVTFDDGPVAATERQVIPLLRRTRTRATFFVVGRRIRAKALQKEQQIGAVGNHTWTHANLPALSVSGVASEIIRTQEAIRSATGRRPNLLRPPYGAHNATVDRQARALGLAQILWSIDSYDSRGYSTEQIAHTVLKLVQPGSIILLHDTVPSTVRALRRILRILKAREFKLVTVGELLALDPPSLAQLKRGLQGCYSRR